MGEAYAGIGDVKRSLDWYQQGVEERAPNMIYLRAIWLPDAFRKDVRFQSLLGQMNFPR